MALISIAEQQQIEDNRWTATLSFDHGPQYPITVSNPFSTQEEEDLGWYFEEHLRFPFIKKVKAQKAAVSIRTYGETLFGQIFADHKAYAAYQGRVKAGLPTLQIEIAGLPAFHALHWEALKDPDLPTPFAVQATIVRKNRQPAAYEATLQPSPTINLLIVTARPSGRLDVGYRTISRPLVELLRQTELPVQVDILRPGTYEALDCHLQMVSSDPKKGVGYYQIIHFDVHGALLPYEQFQAKPQAERFLYQERYGRDDLAPYEGEKAFLFFETLQGGKADPVEASELAALLLAHQVPIAILNACQSGKQVGDSETSLGSRLMAAGVQLVLAMGYSVTVSAAELLMQTLYRELFAHRTLASAIIQGRRELYNSKARRVYYNQTLDLEDWLLPVVYQNQSVQVNVRPMTPEEHVRFHELDAKRYEPPQPSYGFVGRDMDVLQIEKQLLSRRNILLLRGMGGAGKTTLLRHLGSWWQTTRFVQEVFYFGYDERAWTRQQILTSIAQRLFSQVEYLQMFQPLSLDAQQSLLAKRLRAEPHLLILDNLESITGAHLAIQHTLSKKEQQALHSLLKALSGGKTLVLLGSRGSENWLAPETFIDNIYDLQGLDPEAASALADRILLRHHATHYREKAELQRLLELLDGFPLALEVVLANLAHQTPAQVLEALEQGDVQLKSGDSQKRTENILRCIDYSHNNLSKEAQRLLSCLAPFTSVLNPNILKPYSTLLQQQPEVKDLPFERWPQVLEEAKNWGLLSPDPDVPVFLRLQPVLPYFLRARLQTPEHAAVRQAVEKAFVALYDQVGRALRSLLNSKEAQEKQRGFLLIRYEYENLFSAVKLSIDMQISLLGPYSALSGYLDMMQDPQRGLEMGQYLWNRLSSYPESQRYAELGMDFVSILDSIARWQYGLKQYQAAEATYLKALELWQNNKSYETELVKRRSATIYHQLGVIAQALRQWKQAEEYYQQALQIDIEYNDRYEQAGTYGQLGSVAQEQRQWEQAEQYYQQALHLFIEYNDRYSQAKVYHQLGRVAQEQGQWEQAEQYYQQALQIKVEYNDRYSQASTYHQLGIVAQVQRQWEQAEEYYQQALQIYVEYNDLYEQADTYYQLGRVAQEQGQWEQAEQYYQQALQIYVEYNNLYEQADTYHQLGRVAQEQGQWEQAEKQFLQALQIFQ